MTCGKQLDAIQVGTEADEGLREETLTHISPVLGLDDKRGNMITAVEDSRDVSSG